VVVRAYSRKAKRGTGEVTEKKKNIRFKGSLRDCEGVFKEDAEGDKRSGEAIIGPSFIFPRNLVVWHDGGRNNVHTPDFCFPSQQVESSFSQVALPIGYSTFREIH
jgi:hypothetical protein